MAEIVTFTRIYPHGDGLEHTATPASVKKVLASMYEHQHDDVPFFVRFRHSDGSITIAKPKRAK